jgi:hypothetical protein
VTDLRERLSHHKIVGPNAAIDTAARVVKAHPELRSNALAVLQALELPLALFEARVAQTRDGEAVAADSLGDEQQNNCPPPTPVNENMSSRSAQSCKQCAPARAAMHPE